MTRQRHDRLAKQVIADLLEPWGSIETSREIPGEAQIADLWFNPTINRQPGLQTLGLLGRMASSPCLLEPFRNPTSPREIRSCLHKLFALHAELYRQARRDQTRLPEPNLPRLWILSPSVSVFQQRGFGGQLAPDWDQGVYFLAPSFKTAIIAINQLPCTLETLALRILGRGETQSRAIAEAATLPQDHPLRRSLLEALSSWRVALKVRQNLSRSDQELIMSLSPAYLKWKEETRQEARQEGLQEGRQEGLQEGRQEGLQEGRQEGRQEERQEVIENLLRTRFGRLDDALAGAIAPMLQVPTAELIPLLLNLSYEELLVRFRP